MYRDEQVRDKSEVLNIYSKRDPYAPFKLTPSQRQELYEKDEEISSEKRGDDEKENEDEDEDNNNNKYDKNEDDEDYEEEDENEDDGGYKEEDEEDNEAEYEEEADDDEDYKEEEEEKDNEYNLHENLKYYKSCGEIYYNNCEGFREYQSYNEF
ncbi:hypothetical protein DL98DRAFT_531018 [Cadophora sp. DSE1049]|nr:hypothetical protein DL98DRAFT_531018 [Cadophora sp. DSE1049]